MTQTRAHPGIKHEMGLHVTLVLHMADVAIAEDRCPVIFFRQSGRILKDLSIHSQPPLCRRSFSKSQCHCHHPCFHCIGIGQVRAKEKGEGQGVIITLQLLEESHHQHQESHQQDTHKPAEGDLECHLPAPEVQWPAIRPLHNPRNLTLSYLTFTPIRSSVIALSHPFDNLTTLSSPKPTLTCLPLPPSSPRPPHTPQTHPTTPLPLSSALTNLATSEKSPH